MQNHQTNKEATPPNLQQTDRQRIALFGGTFDPIHIGHLRLLIEIQEHFQFEHIQIIPCRQPALKSAPQVTQDQRLTMIQLALAEAKLEDLVQINTLELQREGPSYTVDTLNALRHQYGSECSLTWIMGMDSFLSLDQWHHGEQIPSLANLLVVNRPGFELKENTTDKLLSPQLHDSVSDTPDGKTCFSQPTGEIRLIQSPPLPIASSDLRQSIAAGRNPTFLLPHTVGEYIIQNHLYGHTL